MRSSALTSPFAGTAPYYARFRAPYASRAIAFIVERYSLVKSMRVLDLGCGPGTLAIPLSDSVAEVVAVDPDAEMLAEGKRLAELQGVQNIDWLRSKAEDLLPPSNPFRVIVIGQAFHWMNRDEVLKNFPPLIEDGGGLALVNPGKRRPQESWEPLAEQLVERFLGPRMRHLASNPEEPEHEPSLHRSSFFSEFTLHEFPGIVTRDIASIAGCIYSRSYSARSLFGDDVDAFETELAEALLRLKPTGMFSEQIETEVLIAPKIAPRA